MDRELGSERKQRVKRDSQEEEQEEVLASLIEEPKTEEERVYKTLADYSFKIFSPDCSTGTAWILDYKLPKKSWEYPTTWYIATNAHVIDNFRFSDNPYKQSLPWADIEDTKAKRKDHPDMLSQLNRMRLDYSEGPKCSSPEKYGYLDMSLSKGIEGEARRSDYGMVARKKIYEPNLFFSAFNFLKPENGLVEDHYTDFVVLEVKFTYEEEARRVTNGFADIYKVDSTEAINIFADSLESRYDREKLNSLEENFYLLAYPGNPKLSKWEYTTNFDSNSGIASRLGKTVDLERENSYRGLVNPKRLNGEYWDIKWGGKKYNRFGHWLAMDHNQLAGGSSGALFIDKDKNAIALKTGRKSDSSWSIPLRSKGLTFWDSGQEIYSPAYDLIKGVDGQLKSYRKQVEEYITSKGEETWLSARGWEHITRENVGKLKARQR